MCRLAPAATAGAAPLHCPGRVARVLLLLECVTTHRDRVIAIAVVAALAACAAARVPYAAQGFDSFSLPKELALHAAAFLVLACMLVTGMRAMRGPQTWLVGGLVLFGWLGCLVAVNPWMATRAAALTTSMAVVWHAVRSIESARCARIIAGATVAAAALIALTVALEAHGVGGHSLPGRAPGGSFGNRNFMAHTLVLLVPLTLLATHAARSRLGACCALGTLALISHAVVLTRSRGAWLGLAVALVVWWVLSARRPAGRRGLSCVAALALGACLAVALPNALAWQSTLADTAGSLVDHRSGTGRGRIVQYENTLRMVSDHPLLGVGAGNWSVAYPGYASDDDPSYRPTALTPVNRLPNSDWLGLAAERGLIALGFLVAFGWLVARDAGRRWRRRDGDDAAAALLATLAGLIVLGAFDAVLLRPGPALVCAVVIGSLSPVRRSGNTGRGRASSAAAAVLAAVCAAGALQASAAIVADDRGRVADDAGALSDAARLRPESFVIRWQLAAHWIRQGDCHKGRAYAHAALALFPDYDRARTLIEGCDRAQPNGAATPVSTSPAATTKRPSPGSSGR